ncbi:uncharacterized protein LOC121627487 [Chelmon rostratus]|uniref:uncharacterized protein LOC121603878 n=1 Tax=Chelmon rostratus TaxID=109905 RepID=UPI001BE6F991|nr:uncharacterized protein LOC121603878 [Chelmon rostratus]XP_041811051.1 uncharacterized protein LOC121619415 [Chelmon rostratus]XP_041815728.1 uncharacterized protein LOC121622798 [Chelmon rostratus]XP_041816989.1 uncharacterized protein LOC121623684 [Chelmon rostratus]XP_041817583.1 uncharacterized protein LOC121624053 [Chelmon rostratus]XP_041820756.1 uncharacterized protein LOC121626354 [Chelmon rostratus]XP_041822346.1 uncharacterized protein LOC121627487 [Chelmon rostratus]
MSDYSSDEEYDFSTQPEGYLYEPEYTDAELYQMEVERAEREREMASRDVEREIGAAAARPRVTDTRWCTCNKCEVMQTEVECYCCHEWDLVMPRMQDLSIDEEAGASAAVCIANNNDLPAILNAGVLETFFHIPKINWKKRPKPAGPDGQLSAEQYRLVAYRIIMEWALKGQTLGPGNRRVLPSCVVALIRRTYPSPSGQYAGFKESNDALQLF